MFKILYDDNGTFSDISAKLDNYVVDTVTKTIVSGEDAIYVGLYKPFNSLFFAFSAVNSESVNLSLEYFNGSSFTSIENLIDRTSNFTRDGFVDWDKPSDEEKATINSIELYWYKLTFDGDTSAVGIKGINQLLSDDNDIKEEEPRLLDSDYYPSNETSYLLYHQAARKEIIQKIRNEGHRITGNLSFKMFESYDLHDRQELRQASKYLVMSKIYFNLSDAPGDKYYEKYDDYRKMYADAVNVFYLSYDKNDNGKVELSEKQQRQFGMVVRL